MKRTECVVGERLWMAFVGVNGSAGRVCDATLVRCEVAATVDGRPVAYRFVNHYTGEVRSKVCGVFDFEEFFDSQREARIWLAGELMDRATKSLDDARVRAEATHKAAEEQIKLAMECEENVTAA